MSCSHEYLVLNDLGLFQSTMSRDEQLLQKIYAYTNSHYDQDICLQDVSDLAGMSKESFCTYFKKHTLKTFTNFVNELRIHKSIRLIKENGLTG